MKQHSFLSVIGFVFLLSAVIFSCSAAFAGDKRSQVTPNFLNQIQQQNQLQWQNQQFDGGEQNTIIQTDFERFPVNTAFANPAHTTAPCKSGIGAGAQGSRFGISFGGTIDDTECDIRMWAESWMAMGQPQAAVEVACTSEMNKKLAICNPDKK